MIENTLLTRRQTLTCLGAATMLAVWHTAKVQVSRQTRPGIMYVRTFLARHLDVLDQQAQMNNAPPFMPEGRCCITEIFQRLNPGSLLEAAIIAAISRRAELFVEDCQYKTRLLDIINEYLLRKDRAISRLLDHPLLDCPGLGLPDTARLINEQKATIIIEHLAYNQLEERHDSSIFTAEQTRQDFFKATGPLRRHIYDHVVPDSNVERDFVQELDTSNEVIVYAKLPKGFFIPTPVGNYNPDWAITFKEGTVKHIYFVAETKGSMSTMQLRALEEKRIECARKFFDEINRRVNPEKVRYDVVTSYGKLMEIVGVEK